MSSITNTHEENNYIASPYSTFWLRFKEEALNVEFRTQIAKGTKFKFTWIINFFLSLLNLILFFDFSDSNEVDINKYLVSVTFGLVGAGTVFFVFIIKVDTYWKKGMVVVISKIAFTINMIFIGNTVTNVCAQKEYESLFHFIFMFLDILAKLIWLIACFQPFLTILISNILSLTFTIIFYLFCEQKGKIYIYAFVSVYFMFCIWLTISSYWLERIIRERFYYKEKFAITSSRLQQVMKFMNCGFMQIKVSQNFSNFKCLSNYNVTYMNNFFSMESKFFHHFDMTELLHKLNSERDQIEDHTSLRLINYIFSSDLKNLNKTDLGMNKDVMIHIKQTGQVTDNVNESKDILIMNNQSNSPVNKLNNSPRLSFASRIFHAIIERKDNFKQFTYVGKRILTDGGRVLSLNIFAKVYSDLTVELLFVDESKSELMKGLNDFVIQSGQFLHDFKNPLLSIAEEITELKGLNDNTFEYIYINCPDTNQELTDNYVYITEKFDFLLKMADYCKCMIGSYEDFSKSLFKTKEIVLSYTEVDLLELLNFIENMMVLKITKKKKLINFSLNYEDIGNKTIVTDDVKLKQILINILSNSEKFTSKGYISLECYEEISDDRRFIRFIINDTGIGMTRETIDKLATPFYSINDENTNKEGCGLGLLIVRELINKLGKNFVINSTYGSGTQISFHIEDRVNYSSMKRETIEDENQPTLINNSYNINLQSRMTQNEELDSLGGSPKSPMEKFKKLTYDVIKIKDTMVSRSKLRKFSTLNVPRCNILGERVPKFKNLEIVRESFELNTPSTCYHSVANKMDLDMNKQSTTLRSILRTHLHPNSHHINISKTPLIKPTFTNLFREFSKSKLNQSKSSPNSFELITSQNLKEIRVLVVDDYDVIRKSITKILMKIDKEMSNYSIIVDEEDDGFRALIRIIESNVYNNQHYDLIIMDEEMNYMNGTELFKLLKYMTDNEIGFKGNFDMFIKDKIIMCSADSKGVKNKIPISENMIVSKPITKSFLEDYITNLIKLS